MGKIILDKTSKPKEEKTTENKQTKPEEKKPQQNTQQKTPQQQNEKKPNSKPQCNNQLVQNLYLDGIQNPKDKLLIPICPEIKKEDVCCNQIDAIKLYKHWKNYSLVKLQNFHLSIEEFYLKFINLSSLIKSLNPEGIPYHKIKYVWKKQEVKKCFDADLFTKEKNIYQQILSQKIGKPGDKVWAEKIKSHLIIEVVTELEKKKYMNKKNIYDYFVKILDDSENFFELIDSVDKDPFYHHNINLIIKLITDTLVKAKQHTKLPDDIKSDTDKFKLQLIKDIDLKTLVTENFKRSMPEKELRHMKVFIVHHYLQKIKDILTGQTLIDLPEINKDQLTEIIGQLVEKIQSDLTIKHYVTYLVEPSNFTQENEPGKKSLEEIEGRIIEIAKEVLQEQNYPAGMKYFKVFRNFITNWEAVQFKKRIGLQLYQNLLGYFTHSIMVYLVRNQFKEKKFVEGMLEKTEELWKQIKGNKYHDKSIVIDPYHGVEDLKSSVINKVKNKWNEYLTNFNSQQQLAGWETHVEGYWEKVLQKFVILNSDNAFVPMNTGESDKEICAVVIKHNLMKQVTFDHNKQLHCRKQGKDFFNIEIEPIKEMLGEMMSYLEKIIHSKKSLLCSVCNLKEQPFINIEANQFEYSKDFCYNIMTSMKEYFEWKNIDFQNLLETSFQYVSCFDQDSKTTLYPYKFPGESFDQIQLKKCLSIQKPDEVKECFDFCNKYTFFTHSYFFEGSLQLLEKLNDYYLAVLRQHGFVFKKDIPKVEVQYVNFSSNIQGLEITKLIKDEEKFIKDMNSGNESEVKYRSLVNHQKTTKNEEKKEAKKSEEKKEDKKEEKKTEKKEEKQKKMKLLKMRILSTLARKSYQKPKKISFIEKMRRKLLKKNKKYYIRKKVWNPITGDWEYKFVVNKMRQNYRKARKMQQQTPKQQLEKLQVEMQKLIDGKIYEQAKIKVELEKLKDLTHQSVITFIDQLSKLNPASDEQYKEILGKIKVETKRQEELEKQEGQQQKKKFISDQKERIQNFLEKFKEIITYSREKYTEIDEVKEQQPYWKPRSGIVNFKKFSAIINDNGLNPLKQINVFGEEVEKLLVIPEPDKNESIKLEVIKGYLMTQEILDDFNTVCDMQIVEDQSSIVKIRKQFAQKNVATIEEKKEPSKTKETPPETKPKEQEVKKSSFSRKLNTQKKSSFYNMLISLVF